MLGKRAVKVIANVRVGEPDVKPTAPSHVSGVFEGNHPHKFQRPKGIHEHGVAGHASARRSTGIRPKAHNPIDPRMPNLSPA
jgi:hypothetical protein